MNGDLDLSGSLGGLRIANPDDTSPDAIRPMQSPQHDNLSTTTVEHNSRDVAASHQVPTQNSSAVQPLELSPSSAGSSAILSPPRQGKDPSAPHNQQRQSMPYTYQDQQQAQFPQYPTMMPQNLHDQLSNASRPVSALYTQAPSNNSVTSVNTPRDQSYRSGDISGRPNLVPRRSSSRGSSSALHAGVPSHDEIHNERHYKPSAPYSQGNGPAPPRKVSRGMSSPLMNASPVASSGPLSSSPYNLEGGPLPSSEDWKERGAAVTSKQDYDINGKPVSRYVKKGVKDFKFGQTLGEGSYSTVLAASDRQTLKEYAVKVLDKRHIIKEKKVKYVNIEKDTLNRLTDHPGVVRLYYTFQDERSLYFVLDLASGGELLGFLKRTTTFDEECTRFYGSQVLDTIEYMHKRGVIHRDLKPENVLLDDKMHVKITDFGTAKILDDAKPKADGSAFDDSSAEASRANSFVGTAEYVSPELLTDKNSCKASDLWAFGCIIYQLLAGRPPFKAGNEYQTFQKIVALDYDFPRGFPDTARDLVERLLVLDPQRRLSIEHIKNHEFFAGTAWGPGLWQQKAPRLKAYSPPSQPVIKLNDNTDQQDSFPPDIASNNLTSTPHPAPSRSRSNVTRPQPRVITELPPPSQLDIEWSPVLTRDNERILKLGNLLVESRPKASNGSHSADAGGTSKFSRFFGGGRRKRQRLVMVTSSGRIIMAAAGGEEKKCKSEISLLSPSSHFATHMDPKGGVSWTVDSVSQPLRVIVSPFRPLFLFVLWPTALSSNWLTSPHH